LRQDTRDKRLNRSPETRDLTPQTGDETEDKGQVKRDRRLETNKQILT
jgi:hypothetical protein